MGILIVVGVVALVLVVFVGLVWLFVRLSRPPQQAAAQPDPRRSPARTRGESGRPGEKKKKGRRPRR